MVLQSTEDGQFYRNVLQGDDVEAVHLHGTYIQTGEEGAGEPLTVVLWFYLKKKKHNK